MPLVLAMEMPHISTIITLIIGAVLLLALVFCLFMLMVASGSASSAKKNLKKLAPNSPMLGSKGTAKPAPEKNTVKQQAKK